MRLLAFLFLELLMGPFQLAAVLAYTIRVWLFNIRRGISGTAYEPLFARVLMHEAGTRPDEASVRIAPHLPAVSPAIIALFRSIGIAARWTGYDLAWVTYPVSQPSTLNSMVGHRTDFFDRLLAEATDPGAENPVQQVVILGAGWDTRAWGSLATADVRIFEVDTSATQEAKRAAVAEAGLSAERVTFVETDFNQRSWFQALSESNFDPTLPTFILWEGVTMYLDEEAVDATLRQVAQLAPGGRIAFDFFSRELVHMEAPFEKLGKNVKMGAKFYGEPLNYGISALPPARLHVARLFASHGLELADYEPMGPEEKPHGGLAMGICLGKDG